MLGMGHSGLEPRGAEREKLRVAIQIFRPLERDGEGIAAQVLRLPPQLDGRVAVAVKYTVFFQNASSIWLICGFFVAVPFGA